MKGDFSRWSFDRETHAQGVLQQQGRVLLDADWNDQTRLINRWQDEAGRSAFGARIAAVAAEWGTSFEVLEAEATSGGAELEIVPGRLWADGWLTYLRGDAPNPEAPVSRPATYLEPPLQSPVSPPVAGTRDAVILEIHRQALNGFQVPRQLIEAALGGVDTTERLQAALALRLLRLAPGETCASILDRLRDDFTLRGKLTVSLQPTVVSDGDCPVVESGGYTGFEHHLYRVEIARVDDPTLAPMFKWSQWGGGLVGRGTFDAAGQKLKITANRQAILRSGLQDFYLEVLEPQPGRPPAAPDPDLSAAQADSWRLIYGARVSLASDDEIDLPAPGDPDELFGSIPGPADRRFFFRLWNGIRAIADFPETATQQLRDGIQLQFEADTGDNYLPGDYWTFPVRAGEVGNPEVLIDREPPEGVEHVRVPLGILSWTGVPGPITAAAGQIHDCRHVFQPLTRLESCCTLRVGDGVRSHGDYLSIGEALRHLPDGGRICVLPGEYPENVLIENRNGVAIVGCGERSRVISRDPEPNPDGTIPSEALPVFHVVDSQQIRIESLAITAHAAGAGVRVEESDPLEPRQPVRDVRLADLHVAAATRGGIEVLAGDGFEILDNHLAMEDVASLWPAMAIEAVDVRIEHNSLRVIPAESEGGGPVSPPGEGSEPEVVAGVGGLWLRGGCERVRVIDNLITGGLGNGITLGHVELEGAGEPIPGTVPGVVWTYDFFDPCNPCRPGNLWIPGGGEASQPVPVAGPPLEKILIERNRILTMGLNGVSVIGFFEDPEQETLIEDLTLAGNRIQGCLERPLENVLDQMVGRMGYGGVVLDDVETLLVRDNRIEENGPDHLEPVCGLYVQHGEGIEIERNRIFGNGAKTGQKAAAAKRGARGGIFIQNAVAPIFEIGKDGRFFADVRGIPAVKVHGNVVSTPLGRALEVTALGPVSVVANQLTSHGVTSQSVVAGTVQIVNLGLALELLGLALLSLVGLLKGTAFSSRRAAAVAPPTAPPTFPIESEAPAPTGLAAALASRLMFNGNVLFTDNQCLLELLDLPVELALTSVVIVSLDDVAMENNQCDCELLIDFVLFHTLVFGITTRVIGNRFKEGLVNALLSALTYGFLNDTSHNQGTHCIMAVAFEGGAREKAHNLQMIETPALVNLKPLQPFLCAQWSRIFEKGQE